ncbi:hypothetical protein J4573_48005 [Actinomadura barringtoniae]|uniref:Uncharacterized protein n=1 Tax=Actinomadura barringtoniae TaxID=1427535 RepID=A0A939PLN7_9ACTN|nr:hypothetical protein [Actinomadura barringtoniae]MBO2454905.1 hypothetical protein [Actinomadura barringtoniae]
MYTQIDVQRRPHAIDGEHLKLPAGGRALIDDTADRLDLVIAADEGSRRGRAAAC